MFDTPDDVPDKIKNNKRCACPKRYIISEVAAAVAEDYGNINIMMHSLPNGPKVTKPLFKTPRKGYLTSLSASAYSTMSLFQKFVCYPWYTLYLALLILE